MNLHTMSSDRPTRSVSHALLARVFACLFILSCIGGISVPKASAQVSKAVDTGALKPGAIEGTLVLVNRPVAGVNVMVRETGQTAVTDQYGVYRVSDVAPGTYTLSTNLEGYQRLQITDVVVKPNSALTLSQIEMHKLADGVTELEPYIVKGEANNTLQLDKIEVKDAKPTPFADGNMDIPRGVNDVQPYYIFDSKKIEQSGALNVEDFLKSRLTMNANGAPNAQQTISGSGFYSNTSSVDLRGLGTNETLILVDGRRMAGVRAYGSTSAGQPDLNGIPLAAIDRIEILPSSASGIYGSGAVGGVVNIILKKNYVGGDIRVNYGSTWDGKAPNRSVALTYGMALEGGKTHIFVTAQYSDSKPLLFGDRVNVYNQNVGQLSQNAPSFIGANYHGVPYGSGVNFAAAFGSPVLTYKINGQPTPSNFGTVPVGYSATSDPTTLTYGQYNTTLSSANTLPTGLELPLGSYPKTKSFTTSIRRQMSANIEAFLDINYSGNASYQNVGTPKGYLVTPDEPADPFNQPVFVTVPLRFPQYSNSNSLSRVITSGANIKLPYDWQMEVDYTHSQNSLSQSAQLLNTGFLGEDGSTPFLVDYSKYPQNLAGFVQSSAYTSKSSLDDFTLRGAGHLFELPWGQPVLTVGLEHRAEKLLASKYLLTFDPATSAYFTQLGLVPGVDFPGADEIDYFPQKQKTNSIYTEFQVPLITPKNAFAGVKSLEFQFSNRLERYSVDAGTNSAEFDPSVPNSVITYSPQTPNGGIFHSKTSYQSDHPTIGIKYAPIDDLTFRVSYATAFLPPTYDQLLRNPTLYDSFGNTIFDPKTNTTYSYTNYLQGGNPGLKPQHDKNWNAGLIYEPKLGMLQGLRIGLEYYNITQLDAVSGPTAQDVVSNPSFANRVTRDPITGLITTLDLSLYNAPELKSAGYDINLDYRKTTPVGFFEFNALASYIDYNKKQLSVGTPLLDYAGYRSNKVKWNATATWQRNQWRLGWTTTYYGQYNIQGAPGDPNGVYNTYTLPQGRNTAQAQVYHDVSGSYEFSSKLRVKDTSRTARITSGIISNVAIQAGIKNIFNAYPSLDASSAPYYYSQYGNLRLREFWVSIKKSF